MKFILKLKIENFLKSLRGLPDKQKKIIVWTIAGILAVLLGVLWLKISVSRFEGFQDSLQDSLKDIKIPSPEETNQQQ